MTVADILVLTKQDEVFTRLCEALSGRSGVRVHQSRSADEAQELVREALQHGCTHVVVAGGDGLVNLIAQQVVGADDDVIFGVIAEGTANDLARHLGLQGLPWDQALAVALGDEGDSVDMDVIEARWSGGSRIIVNQLTAGIGAHITHETPEVVKNLLGGVAYAAWTPAALADARAWEVHVEGGELDWAGNAMAVSLANGESGGGGLRLHEAASVRDGILDLMIAPEPLNAEAFTALAADLTDCGVRRAVRARGPTFTLVLDRELPVNVDGERLEPPDQGEWRVEIRVLPGALRIRVPDAGQVA